MIEIVDYVNAQSEMDAEGWEDFFKNQNTPGVKRMDISAKTFEQLGSSLAFSPEVLILYRTDEIVTDVALAILLIARFK